MSSASNNTLYTADDRVEVAHLDIFLRYAVRRALDHPHEIFGMLTPGAPRVLKLTPEAGIDQKLHQDRGCVIGRAHQNGGQ